MKKHSLQEILALQPYEIVIVVNCRCVTSVIILTNNNDNLTFELNELDFTLEELRKFQNEIPVTLIEFIV